MDRCELAHAYHKRGFNCCQSVLAAFEDLTHLGGETCFSIAGGFGAGAGTGELCGAVTGAVMTLGMLTPADAADPAGSKKRAAALSREFQKRFSARFQALRCRDLLQRESPAAGTAAALGLTNHCDIMIVTAVELVEEMLKEAGKLV